MKNTLLSVCACLSLMAAAPKASALLYTNADLLLVVHDTSGLYDDCEFDLGPVSQYENLSAGSRMPVSWNSGIVVTNYGGYYGTAVFTLMAAATFSPATLSSDYTWATCGDASSPTDQSGSAQSALSSTINAIGTAAAGGSGDTSTQDFATNQSSSSSYSYVGSEGGIGSSARLDGGAPFNTQESIPGTARFFQIGVDDSQNPAPATELGAFSMDANLNLKFVAGAIVVPPPSPVVTLTRAAGINSFSFSSVLGPYYQLYYTTDLTVPTANWTPIGTAVAGTGGTLTLEDSNPTDQARYYIVAAYY